MSAFIVISEHDRPTRIARDKRGNEIHTGDTLRFTPPLYPNETDHYAEIRGRLVTILRSTEHPDCITVMLKSKDPVAEEWLTLGGRSYYPSDWLTIED